MRKIPRTFLELVNDTPQAAVEAAQHAREAQATAERLATLNEVLKAYKFENSLSPERLAEWLQRAPKRQCAYCLAQMPVITLVGRDSYVICNVCERSTTEFKQTVGDGSGEMSLDETCDRFGSGMTGADIAALRRPVASD